MAREENLIDIDFDIDDFKKEDDHPIVRQLDSFDQSDAKRNRLILKLYEENQSLKDALEQQRSDLARILNDRQQADDEARQNLRTHNYVTVLIDGNDFTFREDLLRKGAIGGDEAAYHLYSEVREHIKPYDGAKEWKIIVQVYVDTDGLLQKLNSSGLVCDQNLLQNFSRGFSRHQSLFNIIDVGHGSEQVNIKIEGVFDLAIHSVQCQHIILGHRHDQHLVKMLKPYEESILDLYRITLLNKSDLKPNLCPVSFTNIEFPSVFGAIKLVPQLANDFPGLVDFSRRSVDLSPASFDLSGSTILAEDTDESVFQNSKGSRVSSPSIGSTKSPVPFHSSPGEHDFSSYKNPPSTWDPNRRFVLLNVNNERVDTYLGKVDAKALESMTYRAKDTKICNDFHLNKKCWTSDCPYAHAPQLDSKQLVVLRYWARRIPCDQGSACRSIDCWYGHTCVFDKQCNLPKSCRFKHVHHVDRRAVKVWRPGLG